MILFGGILSVKAITFLTFTVFLIAAAGYLLGKITVKGVNLGTAGVFIMALVYGVFLYKHLGTQLQVNEVTFVKDALKIVENVGLVLFVTAVGYIAGPNFFRNLKKNFKSYIVLGLIIILSAGLSAIAVLYIGGRFTDLPKEEFKAIVVGLLSGALTSTPAFSAAKEAIGGELDSLVAVGNGIAYLFGVIGVVLFVQLMPRFEKADMETERAKLTVSAEEKKKEGPAKLTELDPFGFCAFSIAAVLGMILGSVKVAGFSLTVTGGCIIMALVLGHFGRVGKISIMPKTTTLRVFRELGLMLFLIGAGVAGGASFIQYFKPIYFVYGIFMTLIPMIIGFLFAKFVLKLPLLNNLGSITGGMTSTPALGTLIATAGTEDVASAYAATYPIALISIVIASKLIIQFC
ncbi:MAG: permease [Clostridia bacterium]|nr:permease [Clostridia bacterium]